MLNKETLGASRIEIEGNPDSIGVALVIVGIDPSKNGENETQPYVWTIRDVVK